MPKKLTIVCIVLVATIVSYTVMMRPDSPSSQDNQQNPSSSKPRSAVQSFDKNKFSTSSSSSLWVVVNKQRQLSPMTYVPESLVTPTIPQRVPGDESMLLRKEAAKAMEQMFAAAKKEQINLMLASGYRSFSSQTTLYNGYVRSQGQAAIDTQSARPGYSEHQTGLAADIEPTSRACEVEECFGSMVEGKWLASNGYKYGFIIRYPKDKVPVTGYTYEPWHVRYIGTSLAAEMHGQEIKTLEEFFGLSSAPGY